MESRVREPAGDSGIFAGVDTTLLGLADGLDPSTAVAVRSGLEVYRASVVRARETLGALEPWAVTPHLQRALRALSVASTALATGEAGSGGIPVERLDQVLQGRKRLVEEALLTASGIVVDARLEDQLLVPGERARAVVEVWNGGPFPLESVRASLAVPGGWEVVPDQGGGAPGGGFFDEGEARVGGVEGGELPPGALARWAFDLKVPEDASPSRLYYLEEGRDGAIYRWPESSDFWGLPGNPPPVVARIGVEMGGEGTGGWVEHARPALYRGVDKATGEFREPVLIVPALSISLTPSQMVWPEGASGVREFVVHLRNSGKGGRRGSVSLVLPDGWGSTPSGQSFHLQEPGAEVSFSFHVEPPGGRGGGSYEVRALALTERGEEFGEGVSVVDYPHIPRAALFRQASARVSVFPVEVRPGLKVGYVMGSGDSGLEAIRQMGVEVELLDREAVRAGDFSRFDVVVLGIRAYETRDDLTASNERLLDFARGGGTVIVQYNKYEYPQGDFAPYPVEMARPHDRVSDETAPVRILATGHPVFLQPNRIGPEDFDGWAQERGLYFLSEWDPRFTPLLEMADPGEEPKRGGLVVASVGEGVYVYAGLAFFRQFPEGVPGAYRLFANLLSLKGEAVSGQGAIGNGHR
jgi:hypothetical protein